MFHVTCRDFGHFPYMLSCHMHVSVDMHVITCTDMQNKSCMQFGVALVTVVSNGYLKSLYTTTRYLNTYDIVEQSSMHKCIDLPNCFSVL